jgi:hypothetical protein
MPNIEKTSPFATGQLREKLLRVVECSNGLVGEWKWSWRYMEWQRIATSRTVLTYTRNPFRVWRNR